MGKFRSKPCSVEAYRFEKSNTQELFAWISDQHNQASAYETPDAGRIPPALVIRSKGDLVRAELGSWIVHEGEGRFVVYSDIDFREKFEPE